VFPNPGYRDGAIRFMPKETTLTTNFSAILRISPLTGRAPRIMLSTIRLLLGALLLASTVVNAAPSSLLLPCTPKPVKCPRGYVSLASGEYILMQRVNDWTNLALIQIPADISTGEVIQSISFSLCCFFQKR
jgi:hypothetical protein